MIRMWITRIDPVITTIILTVLGAVLIAATIFF